MRSKTKTMLATLAAAAVTDKAELAEFTAMLESEGERKNKRPVLITTRQAAELAEVSKRTIHNWGRRGWLHPKKITRSRVRWDKVELEDFLLGVAVHGYPTQAEVAGE